MEKKNDDNKKIERSEIWNETYTVEIDNEKNLAIIEDINVEKEQISEDRVAICDYCNSQMGKLRDLKEENIISPEKFAKAIKNGLVPPDEQLAIYKNLGDEALNIVIENWKVMAMRSQTPWALCTECLKIIEKYIKEENGNSINIK